MNYQERFADLGRDDLIGVIEQLVAEIGDLRERTGRCFHAGDEEALIQYVLHEIGWEG
jgi:hypothetical protein